MRGWTPRSTDQGLEIIFPGLSLSPRGLEGHTGPSRVSILIIYSSKTFLYYMMLDLFHDDCGSRGTFFQWACFTSRSKA